MTRSDDRYESYKKKVEEAHADGEISDRDFRLIEEFREYDIGDNSPSTVANHIHHLHLTTKRSDKPLAEMDADDLNSLLSEFRTGVHPDVEDSGLVVKNYQSALRKFYRFHDDLGVDDERDIDAEDPEYDGRDLTPEDVLYKEDVDKLFAATRRRSIRDLAVLAVMLSTGLRADAVRTLRLRHVETDGPAMEITLNEEGGDLKGASGSRALLWGKHYLRPWYEDHPHSGDPGAPLFPAKKRGQRHHTDHPEWTKKPIAYSTLRKMVNNRADDAGLEDLYPHKFRYSALTRMAADPDLSQQQIKQIAGWSRDSSQFDKYVQLADQIATDSVREAKGVPTSDSGTPVVGRPSLDRCPQCNDQLREGAERCPTCQTALTHSEAESEENIQTISGVEHAEHDNKLAARVVRGIAEQAMSGAEPGSELFEFGENLMEAKDDISDDIGTENPEE